MLTRLSYFSKCLWCWWWVSVMGLIFSGYFFFSLVLIQQAPRGAQYQASRFPRHFKFVSRSKNNCFVDDVCYFLVVTDLIFAFYLKKATFPKIAYNSYSFNFFSFYYLRIIIVMYFPTWVFGMTLCNIIITITPGRRAQKLKLFKDFTCGPNCIIIWRAI